MRVLMTGGYGCIGSWVVKQLADTGQDVWIYDLREDNHRLDLILEPGQRAAVHFLAGDVSDAETLRTAVERVGATHLLHLAGLQTPTCKANPHTRAPRSMCWERWRSLRRPLLSRIKCSALFTRVRPQSMVRPTTQRMDQSVTSYGYRHFRTTAHSKFVTSSMPGSTGLTMGSPASAFALGPSTVSDETSA